MIVNCRRPSTFALARLALLKHDRTTKHRNRTSNFFRLNIGTSDIGRFTRIGRSLPIRNLEQEGQHPLTGQRAPPISVGAGLIGDLGL